MNYINEINSALKEFSLGKKELAYKKLIKILKKNESDHQLRYNVAIIEKSLGLSENAKQNYLFLINKNNHFKSMINLYLLYIEESDFINALNIIDRLIENNNQVDTIIKDKAFVLYKLKKYSSSINICESFLKKKYDINFINILGLNYFGEGKYEEAIKILRNALKKDENNPYILNTLGRIFHERRDSKNAEKYLVKAFSANENSFEIINNLAGFYREEGNYNKSIQLYKKALNINPKNSTIINNLAKAYFDIDKIDLAEKFSLQALKLNEHDGNIKKILSLIYLRKQDYKNGWHYFDGRLGLTDFVEKNSTINNIREKILLNKKLNTNKKFLILREQGIGDEILYGTMYADLLNTCENVTIECDKRLKNIFCNSFPNFKNSFINFGEISANNQLLKNYDNVIYAGSLGKFFRNKVDDFSHGNYLIPEEKLFEKYSNQLKNYHGKINVGISWKSFKNRYAGEKSLSLEYFLKIFETRNCNFINLQYGDVNDEIRKFNKKFNTNIITIEDLDLLNDFDNLASLLKNLNLFISVSNSTAHLAGSLGVKTLLIRPSNHAVFHYWNQPNNTTPWYKSIVFLNKEEILNEKNLIDKYLSI